MYYTFGCVWKRYLGRLPGRERPPIVCLCLIVKYALGRLELTLLISLASDSHGDLPDSASLVLGLKLYTVTLRKKPSLECGRRLPLDHCPRLNGEQGSGVREKAGVWGVVLAATLSVTPGAVPKPRAKTSHSSFKALPVR